MADLSAFFKPRYANSHALVIGIDHYAHVSPLSYAVNDACEIKQLLIDELGFAAVQVTYLADGEATRDNIRQAFHAFASETIDVDDRLLVFYAGHGMTRTGIRGEIGYLVPCDGDPNDLSSLIRWDDLTRNADLIRAKHILFIMDACYGGLALTRMTGPGSTRFLKDMMRRLSRQVLTAGKADEEVADSGGPIPGHSVFTGHLIEGLRGKAATADGIITASGLMAYVYGKVANDPNSRQTPHYGHVDGDGDFIFKAPSLVEPGIEGHFAQDVLIEIPYPQELPVREATGDKVRHVKSLLATESASIELHDYMVSELKKVIARTGLDAFPVGPEVTQEEISRRVKRYEDTAMDLSLLLACVAHWAKPAHRPTLQKILSRSVERIDEQSGQSVWLALRWYPIMLQVYCTGIAAIESQRYDALAATLYATVPGSEYRSQAQAETVADRLAEGVLAMNRSYAFKNLPGHDQHYVPMSEHLFTVLQPGLDETLFLGKSYEQQFEEFEVYLALVIGDRYVQRHQRFWSPLGRFGWKFHHRDNGPLQRLVTEGRTMKEAWPPLQVGLFGGSFERFDAVATELVNVVSRQSWY